MQQKSQKVWKGYDISVVVTALLLALFAVVGTGMVAVTFESTWARIDQQVLQAQLRSLNQLVAPHEYDNNFAEDIARLADPDILGVDRQVEIYRARKQGQPVAAVIRMVTPNGYSGDIELLVAVDADGVLKGSRVIAHRETPGLGDAIDIERSPWINQFINKSLHNPGEPLWKVKKDKGEFDQLTGATVTSRAVVDAVYRALLFFKAHRPAIFAPG